MFRSVRGRLTFIEPNLHAEKGEEHRDSKMTQICTLGFTVESGLAASTQVLAFFKACGVSLTNFVSLVDLRLFFGKLGLIRL